MTADTITPFDKRPMERPVGRAADPGRRAVLARNWWAVLLRGIVAIGFAALTFVLPGLTLASLVLLFAIYMVADGILGIIAGVRAARHHERWGWLVLEGVLDIVAGAVALVLPVVTVFVFVALAAAWAIVSGIAMLIAAVRLDGLHGRWFMAIAGLLSAVWGVLLVLAPVTGALVLTLWVGAYALAFGIMMVVLAFRLRARHHATGG